MAYTLQYKGGTAPSIASLEAWLTEQGERCDTESDHTLTLRALPLSFRIDEQVLAYATITATTPLWRLVRVVFELSNHLGADVRLLSRGNVSRTQLWIVLADEQDRLRIVDALANASQTSHAAEIHRSLWALLADLGQGRDLRWSESRQAIVQVDEVGTESGISETQAAFIDASAANGDEIEVPVRGSLHSLAWRWLSDAFPGLSS